MQGDASSLELAAAEMAIAAATLVQMEREILDLTETEVFGGLLMLGLNTNYLTVSWHNKSKTYLYKSQCSQP